MCLKFFVSVLHSHRAGYFLFQFPRKVGEAEAGINVDADSLSEDEFHAGRMAQSNCHFQNQVNMVSAWSHTIQVHGIMHGGIPGCNGTYLFIEKETRYF